MHPGASAVVRKKPSGNLHPHAHNIPQSKRLQNYSLFKSRNMIFVIFAASLTMFNQKHQQISLPDVSIQFFFASYVFLPLLISYFFYSSHFFALFSPISDSNLSASSSLPISHPAFLVQSLDQSPTPSLSVDPPLLFSQQQSLCLTPTLLSAFFYGWLWFVGAPGFRPAPYLPPCLGVTPLYPARLRYGYKKRMSNHKPKFINYSFSSLSCGADETRTRDPRRDRPVF